MDTNRYDTVWASERRETAGAVNSPPMSNVDGRGGIIGINISSLPGVNEKQTITVDAAGGTFTVTFGAQVTGALAFDITAAALQAALEALSTIGAGNILVTGGPGDAGGTTPYALEFIGALASTNVAAVTTDATNLTGGAGTAAVATTQAGAGASTPSIVFKVQGWDKLGDTWYDILTAAAMTTATNKQLVVYPGVTAAANLAVSHPLPPVWRMVATAADDDPAIYSVGVAYIL